MVYLNEVNLSQSNKSAFGELLTSELTTIFHLIYSYNINTENNLTVISASGTVTQSNGLAIVSTGVSSTGAALLKSKRSIPYQPGTGIDIRFTNAFPVIPSGGTQKLMCGIGEATSASNILDGYFFGYDSSNIFKIFAYSNGALIFSVSQSSFNVNKLDGTNGNMLLDPTKINVYRIFFQWLGAGMITFQIEDSRTGQFVTVHQIQYANTYTLTSSRTPFFRFISLASAGGIGTNISLNHGSVGCFIQGKEWGTVGLLFSQSNTKSITTEQNIITLQNKSTYIGATNRIPIFLRQISFSSDGTKNVIFNIYINTTLGGVPSYTDISASTSVVSYDTSGTTVTGGRKIASYVIGKSANLVLDISELNIILYPTDLLTISAISTSSNDVFASLIWVEDST